MTADEVIANLVQSFESQRPAQGYLLVGDHRGPVRQVVDHILSYCFCTSQGTRPCGTCRGCEEGARHTHSDCLWVEPQKKSRRISIQQIRDLQQRMVQTSFAGGWKVAVLSAADRLGVEASNAFLKTLEEPPGQTVFFLLTDSPQFLLPTIVSRCQRVSVAGQGAGAADPWRDALLAVLSSDDGGGVIGALSVSGRLAGILKEMRDAARQEEEAAAESAATDDDDDTLEARIMSRYKEMRTAVMALMLSWYRDILLHHCGADDNLLVNQTHATAIRERSERSDYRRAMRRVALVEEMNRRMEQNLPEAAVLDDGFSRMP